MVSAAQHLAQCGITVDVAKQWILANINNLQVVYQARAVKTKKIDSNGDGFYNILKTYDETGTELTSEEIETNESTLHALTFDMYA